jgi:hypothetical protein
VEGKQPATNEEMATVMGPMESAQSLQTTGATLVRGRRAARSVISC